MFAQPYRLRVLSTILVIVMSVVLLLVGVMAHGQAALGPETFEQSPITPVVRGTETTPVVISTEPWIESVPGRVIVKVKLGSELTGGQAREGGKDSSLAGLLRDLDVSAINPLFATAQTAQARGRGTTAGLERIYRLDYSGSIPLEHAVALLAADPNVEYAEPDYVARAARIPNDTEYNQQWALAKINAPAAWDVSTGSGDVVIAVIDSGLDLNHPEFTGRLWVNSDEQAGTGVDNDLNGFVDDLNGWNVFANNTTLDDDNGHGTQVAGVIGAASDNGVGVAGMCWACKLMIVKASQATGIANYSDIAAGITYAASNGAHVINLSLGGYADSAMLRDAIREAATTAVIVAGAGNDDTSNPFYPAAYPEVMAVAATDQNDQKAVFSDYGAWVDVTAPGTSIRTTQVGGYATADGTSFSAPFVAGLAGLIRSAHPTWSPELVKWQILNTATGIESLNPTLVKQLGYGRIDAGSALVTAPQARAAVESYAIDSQANGRPAPGQTFSLVLTLRNLWMPTFNLQATLTSSDPYVTISDAAGALGSIDSGKLGSNSADPFGVTVANNAPYNHPLALTLSLSGDGYSFSLPFTLSVRSAVETLGNTQYVEDTLWTSDKTYILNGAIIVVTGVTLTIQPGTVVKGNSGVFIRVDGTLIAQGTPDQPIVFTTNSDTKATWAGIRFTESAVDASFDLDGHFQSGSVIQYVELSHSQIGISLGSRAPYIADSVLQNNITMIRIGNNNNGGSPRIERNEFIDGGPISIDGGQTLIQQNSFVGVQGGVTGGGSPTLTSNTFRNGSGSTISISGSPTIRGNHIQNNSGMAIQITCCASGAPVIRDNIIVGNGGGINASNLQLVDIEGNLIAGNTGPALYLNVRDNNSVRLNTIIDNTGNGISVQGNGARTLTIANNNLFDNGDYEIYVEHGSSGSQNFTINATNNFWNVTAGQILARIRDCTFDENACNTASSTLPKVNYTPVLTEPEPDAPAFVRSVTLNPNPVGQQRGVLTVDFSRPMITTTLPTATFYDARRGSTEKMFDYAVQSMTEDVIGRLWFAGGTAKPGVQMFDGQKWTSTQGITGTIVAIHGASNGDVWFAHRLPYALENPMLSRLQGTTWITYTSKVNASFTLRFVATIAEDTNGNIWFGESGGGAVRFDGSTWRRYAAADGLGNQDVSQIESDGQGRLWFRFGTYGNTPVSLSMFNGISWNTYGSSDGFPSSVSLGPIYADSHDRVWVGINEIFSTNDKVVAMYDGSGWTFFGTENTGGLLSGSVRAFLETSSGVLWLQGSKNVVSYQDGVWSSVADMPDSGTFLLLDAQDNLWYNQVGLHVRWVGANHAFTDGQWLSPAQLQVTYDFDARIPQGDYRVELASAVGGDNTPAYGTSGDTFSVQFAGSVSTLLPLPPTISAETDGNLSNLNASWQAQDSNIDLFRYAIGTFPGARDTVGWTYLAGTSVARNDLQLQSGRAYYVTVQARNSNNLWSKNSVSQSITAGTVTNPTPTLTSIYLPAIQR